jgi:hypothetical protein
MKDVVGVMRVPHETFNVARVPFRTCGLGREAPARAVS